MTAMTPQITKNSNVCSTNYLRYNQWKHKSPQYCPFVREIQKGPVTRKAFPCHCHDVIVISCMGVVNITS